MSQKIAQPALLLLLVLSLAACAKQKKVLPSEQAVFHNNRGITYLGQSDLEKASFEFRTAMELAPNFAEPVNNLGILFKIKGEYAEAIDMFQQAKTIDKNYPGAYTNLASVYIAQGRLKVAEEEAKAALKIDSMSADTHYTMGQVQLEKYKKNKNKETLQKAEESLKKSTVFNPTYEPAHLTLARLYREKTDYTLAVIRYRLALESGNNSKVWEELGDLYNEMGDIFKSQNCFQKAAELNPKSEKAHLELGTFYLKQQRFPEAITSFNGVVQINPQNEKAHFSLGTLKMEQENFAEAVHHFQQALLANPAFADAAYNLGLAYLKMGSLKEAEESWEKTTEIEKDYARAHYNLGLLRMRGEKKEAALKSYCHFIQTAGDNFPSEEESVEKILEENHYRCRK